MAHAAAPAELESDKGLVVTSQHLASNVGAAILRQGGNAIEAIGIAPTDAADARALQFPRPAVFYGANDSRAPAGSAAAP
jgi:hypothetical protein